MRHVKIFTLIALAPYAAQGAVEPGSYLFLHSQLVGCGDKTFVVDYAQVPENGEVTFLDEYVIRVLGLSEDEIAFLLARKIGTKTGHTPKTLSVQVVPATDLEGIATELMKVAVPLPTCPRRKQPLSPPPDLGYVRSLADASQNTTLRRPLLAGSRPSPRLGVNGW